MRAIRIHQHGNTDVLKIDNFNIPKLRENQVLVEIKNASLNHLDLFVRNGIPGVPLPIVPGSDGSGIIRETGSKVSQIKPGDEVIIIPFETCKSCESCINNQEQLCKHYQIRGEHFDGCQAEYIVVNEEYVLLKPFNLPFAEAAAFPLAYMTAFHMLNSKANLQSHETVFIWGASSGVGSGAIQIAKSVGAKVISTIRSDEYKEYAKKLGADYIINYKANNIAAEVKEITNGKGVDAVIEHPGKSTLPTSLRILKVGGKIVTCGATTGPIVSIDLRYLFIKHQQLIGSTMGNKNDLCSLINLIENSKIKPVISKIFHFTDIQNAHKLLEEGKQLGKIVLEFN